MSHFRMLYKEEKNSSPHSSKFILSTEKFLDKPVSWCQLSWQNSSAEFYIHSSQSKTNGQKVWSKCTTQNRTQRDTVIFGPVFTTLTPPLGLGKLIPPWPCTFQYLSLFGYWLCVMPYFVEDNIIGNPCLP